MKISFCILGLSLLFLSHIFAQTSKKRQSNSLTQNASYETIPKELYSGLKWRNIGPFRSGRCIDVCGVIQNKNIYYAAQTGGGIWKTTDGGVTWN